MGYDDKGDRMTTHIQNLLENMVVGRKVILLCVGPNYTEEIQHLAIILQLF